MTTPAELFDRLLREDAAAPRITCYDDTDGPTRGERIELSGRVLGTWAAKAANALQEEWDLEPGGLVRLDLDAHWRVLYWALATWQVGGGVVLGGVSGGPTDSEALLVTDGPDRLARTPAVLVTRAALARSAGVEVPTDVMDEAADLASFGDTFDAWAEPSEDDPALLVDDATLGHGEVVAWASEGGGSLEPGARVQVVAPSTQTLLQAALAAWSVGGSLVVHLGAPDPDDVTRRADAEGVTRSL